MIHGLVKEVTAAIDSFTGIQGGSGVSQYKEVLGYRFFLQFIISLTY